MSKNPFFWVFVSALTLASSGVLVFHWVLDVPWTDAVYFAVTIITTVGFGDYNLRDAPPWVKIYGAFLMLSGAASTAAIFGGITDYLIRSRLADYFGPKRVKMKNHIIVCGLENVGIRILEQLSLVGEEVVAIEKDPDNRFLDEARALKIPVIIADMRLPACLEKANVKQARSIIAVAENDLLNLEIGLNARSANNDIQVILRIFDHELARKIQAGFGFKTALSTSALAAPAFAMAAVDPSVRGTFYVGEELMLTVEVAVEAGAPLASMTAAELRKQGFLSLLSHTRGAQKSLHPADDTSFAAGDRLLVAVAPAQRGKIATLTR